MDDTTTAEAGTIQYLIEMITNFLGNSLIPFLFTLAFLFFLVNAVRFFFFKSGSEEGRKSAQKLMIWGIAALVFLIAIWGIVGVFLTLFGIGGQTGALDPDFEDVIQETGNNTPSTNEDESE